MLKITPRRFQRLKRQRRRRRRLVNRASAATPSTSATCGAPTSASSPVTRWYRRWIWRLRPTPAAAPARASPSSRGRCTAAATTSSTASAYRRRDSRRCLCCWPCASSSASWSPLSSATIGSYRRTTGRASRRPWRHRTGTASTLCGKAWNRTSLKHKNITTWRPSRRNSIADWSSLIFILATDGSADALDPVKLFVSLFFSFACFIESSNPHRSASIRIQFSLSLVPIGE